MTTEENEQKMINEEYKIWKKNAPFLYDTIISSALTWPSLTVEWFPDTQKKEDDNIDYTVQRILLGTNTGDTDPNELIIAEVRLPIPDPKTLKQKYEDSSEIYGGFGGAAGKIEIVQKIIHNSGINRARYMPQNPELVATKSSDGNLYLFELTKHRSKPESDKCLAQYKLTGHKSEGYGIDWNKFTKGQLISGSDDCLINIYDVSQGSNKKSSSNNNNNNNNNMKEIKPLKTINYHNKNVEDVKFHHKQTNLFGSCGDDQVIALWDLRTSHNSNTNNNTKIKPIKITDNGHKDAINCMSFSPYNENLFLTGGSDKIVCLWDIRNLGQRLHQFEGHLDDIYDVSFSPHSELHFASCSNDRRIMLWDISQIGLEQSPDDAEDGPPELLFIHGGHTDRISSFSWNLNDPWVIASVADNNIIQIWQMTDELLNFDDLTSFANLE